MDKHTILIVDDTPANIALISSLLHATYKTKIATNGPKALSIAASVVADTVNTASRMEGLTKYYGVAIVISETTFRGLADPSLYQSRLLDKVQTKGKKQDITIYEIFSADPADVFERKAQTLPMFAQGQQHYFTRDFAAVLKCFTDVLTALPDDLTTKHYLERSAKFLLEGVPDDWQGIRIMEAK